jgi:hypothetical protein
MLTTVQGIINVVIICKCFAAWRATLVSTVAELVGWVELRVLLMVAMSLAIASVLLLMSASIC